MQRSVTAYFNTRKRQATEELYGKAKTLLLDREKSEALSKNSPTLTTSKVSPSIPELRKATPKINRKLFIQEDQTDIRESFNRLRNETESKNVSFEKKGCLSPRKKSLPVKSEQNNNATQGIQNGSNTNIKIPNFSLDEIQDRICKSSRLEELKASIEHFKTQDQRLAKLQKKDKNVDKAEIVPKIKKFNTIQLEIPVSPQKVHLSPAKTLQKSTEISEKASPQRKLLFEPKQSKASPVKGSPTKTPAYQKYLSLSESTTAPALSLPYKYRFLAEAFRSVDTVSAMLHNRGEEITFTKVKPAVQEVLRKNFSLEHLACIKTVFPEAYTFSQKKISSHGSTEQSKYELVLIPVIPDESATNLKPTLLLERRRKFFNALLARVHSAHEQFLLGLETPMKIAKEKITRWHPEFDVESGCPDIEVSKLPTPPVVEKVSTAKDVLERARSLYNGNMKMMERKLTLNDKNKNSIDTIDEDKAILKAANEVDKDKKDSACNTVNLTSLVDDSSTTQATSSSTATAGSNYLATMFKGIPDSLLEKVRARQSAKALGAITRNPKDDKEASHYSRLPELAKILRNIFVAEKKGVLTLDFVVNRLDNSFRTKLTTNELEDMIRLLCRLLPTWTCVANVRKIDYLKLDRRVDLTKILKRLEILANDKVCPNTK